MPQSRIALQISNRPVPSGIENANERSKCGLIGLLKVICKTVCHWLWEERKASESNLRSQSEAKYMNPQLRNVCRWFDEAGRSASKQYAFQIGHRQIEPPNVIILFMYSYQSPQGSTWCDRRISIDCDRWTKLLNKHRCNDSMRCMVNQSAFNSVCLRSAHAQPRIQM